MDSHSKDAAMLKYEGGSKEWICVEPDDEDESCVTPIDAGDTGNNVFCLNQFPMFLTVVQITVPRNPSVSACPWRRSAQCSE